MSSSILALTLIMMVDKGESESNQYPLLKSKAADISIVSIETD